jgi:hypothetical protein
MTMKQMKKIIINFIFKFDKKKLSYTHFVITFKYELLYYYFIYNISLYVFGSIYGIWLHDASIGIN